MNYIRQRMAEMGYEKYHWEAIRIQSTAVPFTINGYNEFYYLVSKTVELDLVIISDTRVFTEAASYSNFNYYNIQEFSGAIKISQAQAIDYEFIRVVPE